MIVLFVGPDGAGKTTQTELLIKYLRTRGLNVRSVWIRAVHTVAWVLSRYLEDRGFVRVMINPLGGTRRQFDPRRSPWLGRLWLYVELLSLLPLVFLRVKIPVLLGRSVVAERYLLDSITSISYILQDERIASGFLQKFILRQIPEGSLIINLDCNYATILKRRGREAESQDFIDIQRRMNARFQSIIKMLVIDTSNETVEETHNRIIDYIIS